MFLPKHASKSTCNKLFTDTMALYYESSNLLKIFSLKFKIINFLSGIVLGAGVQVLIVRGSLCEGTPGAVPGQVQPIPASAAGAPPQGTAELLSQTGATSVQTDLRMGKNATQAAKT